jgi:hypothetical protein
MIVWQWGTGVRDRGLAPLSRLSRYRGAWRVCGLEPHPPLQHLVQNFQDLVQEVPGNGRAHPSGAWTTPTRCVVYVTEYAVLPFRGHRLDD